MAQVEGMDANFARWYAESLMEEGSIRDLRWKGVVEASKNANHVTAEVLARLAFKTVVPAFGRKTEELQDAYDKLIPIICGGESGFNPIQSARELQILAAAALVRLVESLPDAALIVTTVSFAGNRTADLPMDLLGIAENSLVSLSARKHARTKVDELKLAAPKVNFAVSPEALQSMEPAQWQAQFAKLCDATSASIERVVAGQNKVFQALHKQVILDEEELQMLWWLLGAFSQQANLAFTEMKPKIRPLTLAYELGEMTAVSPGPASIRAMLARASIGQEDLKLADAINAVELEWARSASSSSNVSPATTPIHYALEQRGELASDEAWQAGWSSLTGISANVSLPALKLAELFYREYLFLNVGS
jgi:hypothetical protein